MSSVLTMPTTTPSSSPALARLNPFSLWTSSFRVYFAPRRTALRWRSVSLPAAVAVAILNLLFLVPWVAFIAAAWIALDETVLRTRGFMGPLTPHPLDAFLAIFAQLPSRLVTLNSQLNLAERTGFIASLILSLLAALVIAFFILLPFAARPGNNKACLRHTARAVLLATGAIHLVAPLIGGTILLLIFRKTAPGFENIMTPLFLLLAPLVFWLLAALIRVVRTDYRLPEHLPQPKEPTCDLCGYDLRASPITGRCPECGKPVEESLGQQYRQATAWEQHPSFLRLTIILAQLRKLVFAPRSLFYNMPTRDGQLPAQRWLLGSVTLVGCIAFWIVPGLWVLLALDQSSAKLFASPPNFHALRLALAEQWWAGYLSGGLALAVVWALLALMMVGIETLGVVTYGRFHGMKIELAAAAKTTCYSSTLMTLWAFLGGLQILALAAFFQFGLARHFTLIYSPRLTEGLAVGSLALAHILGLLWFELTVYRGVRAIQFANR
jgi:hypothetical protein